MAPKSGLAILTVLVAGAVGVHSRSLSSERIELTRKLEQRTRVLAALELGAGDKSSSSPRKVDVPSSPSPAVVPPPPTSSALSTPDSPATSTPAIEPLLAIEPAPTEPTFFEVHLEPPAGPTVHGSLRGPTGDCVLLEYRGDRRWLAEGATLKGWQVVHVGRSAVILENAARGTRPPRVVREVYSDE